MQITSYWQTKTSLLINIYKRKEISRTLKKESASYESTLRECSGRFAPSAHHVLGQTQRQCSRHSASHPVSRPGFSKNFTTVTFRICDLNSLTTDLIGLFRVTKILHNYNIVVVTQYRNGVLKYTQNHSKCPNFLLFQISFKVPFEWAK